MLTCIHHISWIRPVEGGLHQCILCQQVVTRKDVYPRLEDLTEELRRRWDEHEARGAAAAVARAPAVAAASERADGPKPAAVATPVAAPRDPAAGGAKPAAVAAPREPAGPRANDPAAPGAAAPARDLGS